MKALDLLVMRPNIWPSILELLLCNQTIEPTIWTISSGECVPKSKMRIIPSSFLAHSTCSRVFLLTVDHTLHLYRYSFPKANNIEFVVHLLDINPYANWLFVNASKYSFGLQSKWFLACVDFVNNTFYYSIHFRTIRSTQFNRTYWTATNKEERLFGCEWNFRAFLVHEQRMEPISRLFHDDPTKW